jgi:hypothetical protein
MTLYEIHITGEPSIIDELSKLNIKNITVELYAPNGIILRKEYMSSFVEKFSTYRECVDFVNTLLQSLTSKVIRAKIETPYDEKLLPFCYYVETHYPFTGCYDYPVSRNVESEKMMCTERSYMWGSSGSTVPEAVSKWKSEGKEIEMCLYDSFMDEDSDWFDLYKTKGVI